MKTFVGYLILFHHCYHHHYLDCYHNNSLIIPAADDVCGDTHLTIPGTIRPPNTTFPECFWWIDAPDGWVNSN